MPVTGAMVRAVDETAEVTLHLPCEARSVQAARRALEHLLRVRGWPHADIQWAQLAVGELVANAVVHAHSDLMVRIRIDGRVLLEVSDRDARAPVVRQAAEPDHQGGRGLQLVERVSRRWGVARGAGSKTVWCEVEPHGAGFRDAG
jgi:anti-sigma regulatory factor (Ser/Thr protein kinase)